MSTIIMGMPTKYWFYSTTTANTENRTSHPILDALGTNGYEFFNIAIMI